MSSSQVTADRKVTGKDRQDNRKNLTGGCASPARLTSGSLPQGHKSNYRERFLFRDAHFSII